MVNSVRVGYHCYYMRLRANKISISMRGQTKETTRVYMIVKPQLTGCITSYTPIINGYMMQSKIYGFPA